MHLKKMSTETLMDSKEVSKRCSRSCTAIIYSGKSCTEREILVYNVNVILEMSDI